MRKEKYRSMRLGEAKTGSNAYYLNDLHLPPISVSIVEVGDVKQGGFMKYQEVKVRVHEYNRIDTETVMENGCERLLVKVN